MLSSALEQVLLSAEGAARGACGGAQRNPRTGRGEVAYAVADADGAIPHAHESRTGLMRDLQSTIQLHGIGVEQFLEYKQLLIDYLERFLSDLVLATNEISRKILLLEEAGIREQFLPVARRALTDSLTRTAETEALEAGRWEGRWHGLRRWFLGEAGGVSQAEVLRARAREAIPALLFTLQNINDQRVTRSDRFADWQTLVLWFAEAPGEQDTHRLWRAAFGMAPARHLQINQETLDRRDQSAEGPRTSTQLTLDLDTLEHTLRCAGLINTLADVALACHGAVENRRAESDPERSECQAVFTAARLRCNGRPHLLAWVNAVAGNGTLKRLAQGDREKAAKLLECAFQVLERDSREEVLLATLAAECAGDSHALDRGQPLGTLCLRGIVAAHGVDGQQSADARREAWATVGVVIDDLSAPALVLNLRAAADPILNRFSGFTGSRRSPHSSLIGSFRAVRISSRRILRRASSLSARIPASSARPHANLARGAGL